MDDPIPITKDIATIYPHDTLEAQKTRWAQLSQRFTKLYGGTPSFVARSPGRVNIIGEHIDYSLYEVLPMAITADILVAVSTLPSTAGAEVRVTLANMEPEKFPSATFGVPASGDVPIDPATHNWTNYVKAGLNGALTHLRTRDPATRPPIMRLLVDGTIPAGSGLSSSAALVCATALAVLHATDAAAAATRTKRTLVDLAITAERAVGVNSGGMDQAASVLSLPGDALSVSFCPTLHAEPVAFPPLPSPITFLIAQSFVAADKALSAPTCYNLRVVECTLAARVMAAALHLTLPTDASPLGHSLRGFQTAYFSSSSSSSPPSSSASPPSQTTPLPDPKTQLETLLSLLPTLLPETEGYTLATLATLLPAPILPTRFPVQSAIFHLHRRAHHVFSEALRVLAFKSLLLQPPPPSASSPQSSLLPRLGALMTESQSSCRDRYECSCAELDRLCDIARDRGAFGARLTGAGWGGCVVCLVQADGVEAVRTGLFEEYYNKKKMGKGKGMGKATMDGAVVVSKPGGGSVL